MLTCIFKYTKLFKSGHTIHVARVTSSYLSCYLSFSEIGRYIGKYAKTWQKPTNKKRFLLFRTNSITENITSITITRLSQQKILEYHWNKLLKTFWKSPEKIMVLPYSEISFIWREFKRRELALFTGYSCFWEHLGNIQDNSCCCELFPEKQQLTSFPLNCTTWTSMKWILPTTNQINIQRTSTIKSIRYSSRSPHFSRFGCMQSHKNLTNR